MFPRSYITLNDRLIFGMAAELVLIQDEWHDILVHDADARPSKDLVDRFKTSEELLLSELLVRLQLHKGQMPRFQTQLFVCNGIRMYLMFEEFRWRYRLAVFSDGVRQLCEEDNRARRYFICKEAELLTTDYGDGSPSGRGLMMLPDGRFLDLFWDVTPTLKQPLDAPYEKFRLISQSRVVRWLHRHDHHGEVKTHYPHIYSKVESTELSESNA